MGKSVEAVKVLAPAKVNLALDIVGELPNGYHMLDSVMLAVDIFDDLTISKRGAGINLSCSDPSLPTGEDNLVMKAARAFFSHTGLSSCGLEINLTKRIPSQAGLAGGSADAAAALAGLDFLYQTNIGADALAEIGLTVGSDLPFCLMGGCARAGGRGEVLTPLPLPPDTAVFLIAKPAVGMSTRLAFQSYDRRTVEPPRPCVQPLIAALQAGHLSGVGLRMANVFEDVISLPQVKEIKEIMLECDCLGAVMTGSGTAVAGLFSDEEAALSCLSRLTGRVPFARLARALACGPKIIMA